MTSCDIKCLKKDNDNKSLYCRCGQPPVSAGCRFSSSSSQSSSGSWPSWPPLSSAASTPSKCNSSCAWKGLFSHGSKHKFLSTRSLLLDLHLSLSQPVFLSLSLLASFVGQTEPKLLCLVNIFSSQVQEADQAE